MDARTLWVDLEKIRAKAPLVHNITNYVVMNNTANALLSLGASPVMAHAAEEVEALAAMAGALVVNIGTLSPPWVEAMFAAGRAAKAKGVPVVLDPVGCGATAYRTEISRRFFREINPEILRGNASEIMAMVDDSYATKGVDSLHATHDSLDSARLLSNCTGGVVSVSGAVDLIVDRESAFCVLNGHPIMPRVTGMGCTATAITGAFAAVSVTPFAAAVHAMMLMGVAGEIAANRSSGTGSFQMHFLDVLYGITESDLVQRVNLRPV